MSFPIKDLRGVNNLEFRATFLGPALLSNAERWRDRLFIWKRWSPRTPDWTHDHCDFCFACICNHRDRFPDLNLDDRGCFRHAYYAEHEDRTYIWVCRNCFKRFQKEFGWKRAGTRSGPSKSVSVAPKKARPVRAQPSKAES